MVRMEIISLQQVLYWMVLLVLALMPPEASTLQTFKIIVYGIFAIR